MGKKIRLQSFPSMSKSDPIARFCKYQVEMLLKLQIKMVLYHIELLNKYF